MTGMAVEKKRMSLPNPFEAATIFRVVSVNVKPESDSLANRAKPENYFSLATTNSGAHNRARLISESANIQIALRADSA